MSSQKSIQEYYQGDFWGELLGPDIIKSQSGSMSSGQKIELFLKIQNNCVADAKAKIYGGPYLIFSAGFFCEWIKNKNPKEILNFSAQNILQAFNFPETKKSSAFLVEAAVRKLSIL